MPKAHELLAVEGQLKGQAEATRKELRHTFDKKEHLFSEKRVTYKPNEEGAQAITEAQSKIQSTIMDELHWIAGICTPALDVAFQVAEVNTRARADVILDNGDILMKDVPTTALLELEKRAAEMQELVNAIPTLDPAKGFEADPNRPDGTYIAREVTKGRTKKVFTPLVLAPATKEHPAQVKEGWEDRVVGTVVEQEWSSLITPKQKGEMLERVEELRRAFKTARQRANDIDVPKDELRKCGERFFNYVIDGKTSK